MASTLISGLALILTCSIRSRGGHFLLLSLLLRHGCDDGGLFDDGGDGLSAYSRREVGYLLFGCIPGEARNTLRTGVVGQSVNRSIILLIK